jgi:hypothetical protein
MRGTSGALQGVGVLELVDQELAQGQPRTGAQDLGQAR